MIDTDVIELVIAKRLRENETKRRILQLNQMKYRILCANLLCPTETISKLFDRNQYKEELEALENRKKKDNQRTISNPKRRSSLLMGSNRRFSYSLENTNPLKDLEKSKPLQNRRKSIFPILIPESQQNLHSENIASSKQTIEEEGKINELSKIDSSRNLVHSSVTSREKYISGSTSTLHKQYLNTPKIQKTHSIAINKADVQNPQTHQNAQKTICAALHDQIQVSTSRTTRNLNTKARKKTTIGFDSGFSIKVPPKKSQKPLAAISRYKTKRSKSIDRKNIKKVDFLLPILSDMPNSLKDHHQKEIQEFEHVMSRLKQLNFAIDPEIVRNGLVEVVDMKHEIAPKKLVRKKLKKYALWRLYPKFPKTIIED